MSANNFALGGAIFNNGALKIGTSIFRANKATSGGDGKTSVQGGAIYHVAGSAMITGSTFDSNIAYCDSCQTSGGAIMLNAKCIIKDSVFTANTATQDGGHMGLWVQFVLRIRVGAIFSNSLYSTRHLCATLLLLDGVQSTIHRC